MSTIRTRSFGVVGVSTLAVALIGFAPPIAHADTSRAEASVQPHTSQSRHRSDFNNDGFDDLVVSAPGESQGAIARTGAVTIVYGSVSGLANGVTLTQDSGGVPGTSAKRNFFGRTIATGDFNNDTYDDVAIGSQQTVGSAARAGTVTILYGGAAGVAGFGSPTPQLFTATNAGVPQLKTTYAYFGGSLAVGDFNGDGIDDLGVGVPGATVAKAAAAGAVTELLGSVSGLQATGVAVTQHAGAAGYPEFGDGFGTSIAAGDLDGDTFDDLIVGTPGEDAGSTADIGVIDVLRGSATGLSPVQDVYIDGGALPAAANRRLGTNVASQSFGGVDTGWVYAPGRYSSGWVEKIDLAHHTLLAHTNGTPGSQHGISMVFGSFSSGAAASMAIGDPYYNNSGGGLVVVRDGANSTSLSQDTAGVAGSSEKGDAFGVNLEVGDYNGDGLDELAVGVPFETISGASSEQYHAGVFYVFNGDALGLAHSASTSKLWTQESPGIPGGSEARDLFGVLAHGPARSS